MSFEKRLYVLAIGAALAASAGGYGLYAHTQAQGAATAILATYKSPEEARDVYVRFIMEAYDSISQNYWQKVKDADMAQLFQLSLQKATGQNTAAPPSNDRAGTAKMIGAQLKNATSTEAKRKLVTDTLTIALFNIAPQGRNQLLSQQQVTELRQEVSNVNPNKDLYQDLAISKDALPEKIEQAYIEQKQSATTTEAKQKIEYAHDVLTNASHKARYDEGKIEPTAFDHSFGDTQYIYLSQISPTTIQEFVEAVNAPSAARYTSLILDLRGNIGGALDFAQDFFGLFQGANQYSFDLFHQGDYQVQRTRREKLPALARYKEIALLTDAMTQSTAEVTTATFKRLHLARVVGDTTRGWGSVENTYPLETIIDPKAKYALLLVNSLTLRDDNQPIESRGVDPDVNVNEKGWQQKLSNYFTSPSLRGAIQKALSRPPIK
jgi:C-terminal processing protease CtpA/Prc